MSPGSGNAISRITVALGALALALALIAPTGPSAETVPGKGKSLAAIAEKYFPGEDAVPPPKRIFRLTRDQLDATAKLLLPALVATSLKETMPRDPLQTNYEYAEMLALSPANIPPLTRWIGEIAARVRETPEALIACAAGKAGRDCHEAAARRFVVRAFRADAPDETIGRIVDFYLRSVASAGSAAAAGDLVEVTLNSPYFLFRRELDTSRRGRLGAAQHLQAITYTLADTPPESHGLRAEEALAHLQTADDARATVDAVLASKAAREKLIRFFRAWLEVREPAELPVSREVFKELTPALASAMVEETERFLRAALEKPAPSLRDVTEPSRSFVTPAVAALYGLKARAPDGAGPVPLDPSQRLGVFTLPAVIASHSGPTNTRLVKRGVFWVRKVMCLELGEPPKDLHESSYGTLETTERKRIESVTRGAACAGCHRMINPFAFMMESYDPLGRWRTTDNGHPVDASLSIAFLDEGPLAAPGPIEALKALTASAMLQQCFVRQVFRFYMGRSEEPGDDPLLRTMFVEFASDGRQDILALLRTLVLSHAVGRRQM